MGEVVIKTVLVVGQGYVGLPLARGAVLAGHKVIGLDLNENTVDLLNSGTSHIDDISSEQVDEMLSLGYRASSDVSDISLAEVVIVCVPTPLLDGGPDLSAVKSAMNAVGQNVTPGALVVLESTTYPGTTEDLILPIIESYGHLLDRDFYLAFSPERIDPGNQTFGLKNTPKVVGGVSLASTKIAEAFYSTIVDVVVSTKSAREAETAKLLENTYRHVNIALVNEMAKFCNELNIDLWDVIRAAKTKPFGFQAFYPGPGVGGHCIPIDPNYLSYEVKKILGYPFRFVELAQEINNSMPKYIVDRIGDALNDQCKSLKSSKVLLLGVTYKANISDQRESPATDVDRLLRNKGVKVAYHDPYVSSWSRGGRTDESVADLDTAVSDADIVVLLQKHDQYDVADLASKAAVFFDTRGTDAQGVVKL